MLFPTRTLATALLLLSLVPFQTGCRRSEPVKLGFLGGMTGRYSSLGIAARNGVTLAVEEINAAGGLNGQPVQLEVVDDRQEVDAVRKGLQALHEAGVAAVIGPVTSSMATEVVPLCNQLQLVAMGPTISTNELSDLDDYFFRPRPASRILAQRIARYMAQDRGVTRLGVIYDTNNLAHTQSWFDNLKEFFEAEGGTIASATPYSSAQQNSYLDLARQMLKERPEGFFILANSIDSGMISQQLRKLGADQPLFASEWSFTNDLLQFGGQAVEGLTICHTYNLLDTSPRFADFRRRFIARFGTPPSFASGHSYDATRFLLAALKRNPDPKALKETLLALQDFEGLQATIRLNRFGDTERKTFLTTIDQGQFKLIE